MGPVFVPGLGAPHAQAVCGIGGLKCEGGHVYLRGPAANTYGFTTTVVAGSLHLAKSNGVNSIGGDLVIDGAYVSSEGNNQLGAAGLITIQGNGQFFTGAIRLFPRSISTGGTFGFPP